MDLNVCMVPWSSVTLLGGINLHFYFGTLNDS